MDASPPELINFQVTLRARRRPAKSTPKSPTSSEGDPPMPRRTLAATVALTLLTILASPLAAQETQISFTTTEGTWVSLDVAPDGGSLVFELLGDVYVLPVEGGRARPVLTGSAFQSQPRFSPDGRLLAYVSRAPTTSGSPRRTARCLVGLPIGQAQRCSHRHGPWTARRSM